MVFTADRENPTLPLHHLCIYLSACLSTIYHTYALYVCAYDMYMYVCMYTHICVCVMCVCVCEYVWHVWGHECTSVQRESRGQLKSVLSYLYCGSGIEFDILKISRQALTELFF